MTTNRHAQPDHGGIDPEVLRHALLDMLAQPDDVAQPTVMADIGAERDRHRGPPGGPGAAPDTDLARLADLTNQVSAIAAGMVSACGQRPRRMYAKLIGLAAVTLDWLDEIADQAAVLDQFDPDVICKSRSVLADVAAVLGGENAVKATDVTARLRVLAPGYAPYQSLTADQLAGLLAAVGVTVRKLNGLLTVRRDRVLAAQADQDKE